MRLDPKATIVVLTGAGVSAESGLRTFRDAGGLWEGHRMEEVATPEAFARNPDLVQRFYDARRRQLDAVEPNAAHAALARLERAWRGEVLLVTQNVDDLHQRAGSKRLIPMHGELRKARCLTCRRVAEWEGDLAPRPPCPACGERTLRPHIVWFGEEPLRLPAIFEAVDRCALFVAVGTSGVVYPAAGLVACTPPGARTVELNLEPGAATGAFKERRAGPATELVPAFVAELLGT